MTDTMPDLRAAQPVDGERGERRPVLPDPPRFDTTTGRPTDVDSTIYRPTEAEPSAEERRLAAERAARKQAREAALTASEVPPVRPPKPLVISRRTTDRFLGAAGLLLLRLMVAAILTVRGLEIVLDPPAAEARFAATAIPEPAVLAMVTGVAALTIAFCLVVGLLTRLAGLGVTVIAAGVLAFVMWGNWSLFVPGRSGFIGEYELLLAAVGLLLFSVGGGGFAVDRNFRRKRDLKHAAEASA